MTPELLREHRELEYLRAAARARPSRRLRASEFAERRRYANARWRKLLEARGRKPEVS
jgi:hypothetical protein